MESLIFYLWLSLEDEGLEEGQPMSGSQILCYEANLLELLAISQTRDLILNLMV